jgi:hypothetical protein
MQWMNTKMKGRGGARSSTNGWDKGMGNATASLFSTKRTKSDAYVEMKQKKYGSQQQMFDFQQDDIIFYLSPGDHLT